MTADDPVLLNERLKLADVALKGLEAVSLVQSVLATMPSDHPDFAKWVKLGLDGLKLANLAGDRMLRLDAAPSVPPTRQ
jgi:hypothetical protein